MTDAMSPARRARSAGASPGLTLLIAAAALALLPTAGMAVEGGTGAYLLGSRDTLAGIVPPKGSYATSDFIYLDGSVGFLALGGLPLVDVHSQAFVLKLNGTQSFDSTVWGGQPALTITLPIVSGDLSFGGQYAGLSGTFSDTATGMGDLTVTPMVGWHQGNNHWAAAASIFMPTGLYQSASVSIPDRSITAVSFSKNRFAVDPVLSYTFLNPKSGLEFSAAGGVTFSAVNPATDYQTAPEAHLELTAMQHLPSKFAFGLTGYVYKQTADDSGSGAAAIKAATGQDSLQAQTLGLGPIITWNTQIGGQSVNFKAKYITEFQAQKRFESNILWVTLNLAF